MLSKFASLEGKLHSYDKGDETIIRNETYCKTLRHWFFRKPLYRGARCYLFCCINYLEIRSIPYTYLIPHFGKLSVVVSK